MRSYPLYLLMVVIFFAICSSAAGSDIDIAKKSAREVVPRIWESFSKSATGCRRKNFSITWIELTGSIMGISDTIRILSRLNRHNCIPTVAISRVPDKVKSIGYIRTPFFVTSAVARRSRWHKLCR